ncbi:MAG: hypothetical protein ABIP48_19595 [Planctomycetota bacterium]
MQVSSEVFRQWLARQIKDYLAAHPEVTVQELAGQIGVSAPTISRWKAEQTNVAEEHHERLFAALGIHKEDLARELGADSVTLPVVRARGAVRTRGAIRTRGVGGATAGPLAGPAAVGHGPTWRASVPRRVFAVLLESSWTPELAWLREAVRSERAKLAQLMGEEPLAPGGFRFGQAECALMTPERPNRQILRTLLEGIRQAGRAEDLALLYLWADLGRDEENRLIVRFPEDRGGTLLAELADWASNAAQRTVLILEGRWPDCEQGVTAGQDLRLETDLKAMSRRGLYLVVAALPQQEAELEEWPFFSSLISEGIRSGEADLNRDGMITLAELCEYASRHIDPRNLLALQRIAAGEPASVVPAPRFISESAGQDVAVAVQSPEGAPISPPGPGLDS